ncbi:MAG: hypothetical protein J6J21_02965 [Clostridia bacterium]|nr:hypothetical protein [Clostridia bacterium]
MCDKRAIEILRRIGAVFFAVLFALLFPVCGVLCTLFCGFSDVKALSESLVDEAYLESAKAHAAESLEDVALLYGMESDQLTAVLDENEEQLRTLAVLSVQSLLESVIGLSEFQEATFDASAFRAVLNDYAKDLSDEGELIVQDSAIEELSADLSAIVSESLSPVGGGLFREAAERLYGVVPTRLYENLGLLSGISLFAEAIFLLFVVLLSQRGTRIRRAVSAFFCAATLYFVPAFFLLLKFDVTALALSEGVLLNVIRGGFLRFATPIRVSSLVLFVLAVVLLFVCAVLYARGAGEPQE